MRKKTTSTAQTLPEFLRGKSTQSILLFQHFVKEFKKIGKVEVMPAKTMIGIATDRKRIAYVTQFGKGFIHVVFPFEKAYMDNLCLRKIAQVPGAAKQFNHHFRMLVAEDINDEVRSFMRLAYQEGG